MNNSVMHITGTLTENATIDRTNPLLDMVSFFVLTLDFFVVDGALKEESTVHNVVMTGKKGTYDKIYKQLLKFQPIQVNGKFRSTDLGDFIITNELNYTLLDLMSSSQNIHGIVGKIKSLSVQEKDNDVNKLTMIVSVKDDEIEQDDDFTVVQYVKNGTFAHVFNSIGENKLVSVRGIVIKSLNTNLSIKKPIDVVTDASRGEIKII